MNEDLSKIQALLHSDDEELQELGRVTLLTLLKSWEDYRYISGRMLNGRLIVPSELLPGVKTAVRKLHDKVWNQKPTKKSNTS
jgi:hypothetical protein